MTRQNKIPKIIHYIWLGGNKKPDNFKIAIKSWQTFAKDWEIREWNEESLKDKNSVEEFVLPQVYYKFLKKKKWAFASDVLRFYILKKYGGFYLDTDEVLLKSLDDLLLDDHDLVISKYHNKNDYYGFGAVGAVKNNFLSEKLIEYFEGDNSYTNLEEFIIINKLASGLINKELKKAHTAKILILEQETFHPEIENKYTKNTYAYHMANTSWVPFWKRVFYKIPFYNNIKYLFYKVLPKCIKQKVFNTKY